MRYIRAYIRAWWDLFRVASTIYIAIGLFAGLDNAVALYLFYLICLAALGGVVGEWIDK